MDLDFQSCLWLLAIIFVLALLILNYIRLQVNRGFELVDYAKEQLYGKKGGGGAFTAKDFGGMIMQTVGPGLAEAAKNFLGGGKAK